MRLIRGQIVFALAAVLSLTLATGAHAADKLRIGFVGVTSGPAAAWGISNVRSMQTRAAWLNEKGGVKIGDKTYEVEIVTFDDQKDPKRAIAGMEKMAQEGIHTSSARMSMTARQPSAPSPSAAASSISPMLSRKSSTRPRHPTPFSAWWRTTSPGPRFINICATIRA